MVDECHHLPAQSFEQVARRAKARYITGLSATVTRKDGHHPIIFMQCGPVRHRTDAKEQALARPFTHTVLVRPTGFRPPGAAAPDARSQFHELYDALTQVTQFEKFRPGFRPGIPRGGHVARGGRRKVDVVTTYPID